MNDIKYAINPAAKMDLVDLTVALEVYDTIKTSSHSPETFGNYFNNSSPNNDSYERMGYEYENDTQFRTPFLPPGCIKNTSIAIGGYWDYITKKYNQPTDIYLKVKAVLRRKDADINTQDVIYISTYKTDIKRSVLDNGKLTYTNVRLAPNQYPLVDTDFRFYRAISTPLFPQPILGIAGVEKPVYPASCSTSISPETATQLARLCANKLLYNPVVAARIGSEDKPNYIQNYNPILYTNNNLSQNYPNPFKEQTRISYSIASNSVVKLYILDVSGKVVHTLVNNPIHEAGEFNISLDGNLLSGGVYFYTLEVNGVKQSKKMMVMH